jgi:hypothetical protein
LSDISRSNHIHRRLEWFHEQRRDHDADRLQEAFDELSIYVSTCVGVLKTRDKTIAELQRRDDADLRTRTAREKAVFKNCMVAIYEEAGDDREQARKLLKLFLGAIESSKGEG